MKLDSVRELKLAAMKAVGTEVLAIAAAATVQRSAPRRFMALGIAPSEGSQGYKLAVRLQREDQATRAAVDRLTNLARGEVDVQFIGRVRTASAKQIGPPRNRPMLIGDSVAHYRTTAGTLGAFVRARDGEAVHILSNNHVIANVNKCKQRDAVLQPSPADGGKHSDRVAGLSHWVPLRLTANTVDCAIAELDGEISYDSGRLSNFGNLAGVSNVDVYDGMQVSKLGRTTKLTTGTITAFEMDDVIVGYSIGNLSFDGQIEVEGADNGPFAQGGDSGSLVMDGGKSAIGLLFATSDSGGTNGKGLTYVNPIHPVLNALRVDLIY